MINFPKCLSAITNLGKGMLSHCVSFFLRTFFLELNADWENDQTELNHVMIRSQIP